jgi:hypothetical protein
MEKEKQESASSIEITCLSTAHTAFIALNLPAQPEPTKVRISEITQEKDLRAHYALLQIATVQTNNHGSFRAILGKQYVTSPCWHLLARLEDK